LKGKGFFVHRRVTPSPFLRVFRKGEIIMIKDLIEKTRSYRRFHQDHSIELETLRELVELARLSAAAGNAQIHALQ